MNMRSWLARAVAIGAITVLATTGVGAAGAAVAPGPQPDEVTLELGSDGDIGVQHTGSVTFSGFGSTFLGRSSHEWALTTIVSGTYRKVMVRAFVCSRSNPSSCGMSAWRSSSTGYVEYNAPSWQFIKQSQHKCTECTLVHRISH
jgi:hypothetical protein